MRHVLVACCHLAQKVVQLVRRLARHRARVDLGVDLRSFRHELRHPNAAYGEADPWLTTSSFVRSAPLQARVRARIHLLLGRGLLTLAVPRHLDKDYGVVLR